MHCGGAGVGEACARERKRLGRGRRWVVGTLSWPGHSSRPASCSGCPTGWMVFRLQCPREAPPCEAHKWDTSPSPHCTSPTLTVPPSHDRVFQTPTCVSAARRGMEAARPWLSSPGWGSPSRPLMAMLCICTSTAWGYSSPPVTLIPHPTLTLTPIPISPPSYPIAPPALSHHPSPHPWEPSLVFLAAPLGSLLSGHAPGGSSPHRAPPGSSEYPRKQTP